MAMPDVAAPRTRRAWAVRALCIGLAGFGLWLGWTVWHIFGAGNLHVVLPGRVYRGAQPSPATLKHLASRHGVRTIVNLRGCCAPFPWYMEECRSTQALGMSQQDLTFSAIRLPSRHELRRLIEVIEQSEYPIYLHCRQGADRTGMAAAVVMLLEPGATLDDARGQLCLRYGHLSVGRTERMDDVLDLYEQWLDANGQEHSPSTFRRWATEAYRGGLCDARIETLTPLGALRVGRPLVYRVRVRNLSEATWHLKPHTLAGVHVCGKLSDTLDRMICEVRAGLRDEMVEPGESFETVLELPPVAQAGTYHLFVDMLDEGHGWFYQTGSEPREEEIVVRE